MKNFLQLLIFLFGIAGNPEIMASLPLKVMTYNIRLDFEGDSLDNWQHRKSDMISFIQAQNPDFVGVQEALFHQMQFLDEQLKNYKYIGVGRTDGATDGEFSAIFYKTDSWTVIEDSTFWLSKTPAVPSKGGDAGFPRICTFGKFEHKSGAVISLFNTHFDHVGKKARKKSVKIIKSRLAPVAKNHPVLLIGDFNVVPSSTVYAKLTAFMKDSRAGVLEVHEASVGTFNGFKSEGPFENRIDYIFVKNENITVKKYQVEMPLTQSGRQLSDHFPVIVEIEIE
jgi:endonuclease/exonuclease/phosphatase family metal-dependent hydrolase